MFRLDSVSDPRANEPKIRRWRCGRIVMRGGKLIEIQQRLLCGNVSVAEVWLQAKYGRRDDDCCWLDYHQPLGMPSFLTLDYIRAGTLVSYKTLIGACQTLDEIARIRSTRRDRGSRHQSEYQRPTFVTKWMGTSHGTLERTPLDPSLLRWISQESNPSADRYRQHPSQRSWFDRKVSTGNCHTRHASSDAHRWTDFEHLNMRGRMIAGNAIRAKPDMPAGHILRMSMHSIPARRAASIPGSPSS